MNRLNDFQYRLLQEMSLRGLAYLVVGGWAVNLHGASRATKDLDLWVNSSLTDLDALELALQFSGVRSDLAALYRQELHGSNAIARLSNDVDILAKLDGLEFTEAFSRHLRFDIEGLSIPVLCRDDLVITKSLSNGEKHAADLESLRLAFL
ncbi:hypothetical protein RA224_09830 [Achromobacter aegrifaciens]|uniref:hypothetical protein n=1 Tax=Achromobacter aegrifaciens TaxID=1287736 RepID=UPI0027B9FC69|nr:hypothetical protein [Achromobacter aegrifaciens]WLW63702.1 hypothetical protein RA224_09830 [Achromobacter aegrifaciens]